MYEGSQAIEIVERFDRTFGVAALGRGSIEGNRQPFFVC